MKKPRFKNPTQLATNLKQQTKTKSSSTRMKKQDLNNQKQAVETKPTQSNETQN